MAIQINPTRVQEALAYAQDQIERTSGAWGYLEMQARCLRFVGDPHASNVFLQAAQQYQQYFTGREDHLLLANLYRLGGDHKRAHTHYQFAFTKLTAIPESTKTDALPYLDQEALCAFRLGLDDRCLQRVGQLQKRSRRTSWLNVYTLPYLINARQTSDSTPALEAVHRNEASIRKGRFDPWVQGSYFSPWDAYEEAQQVVRELGGHPNAV